MRGARSAAYLLGGAAALGAACFLVVYLYRWQWQRTIVCGVLLLVVEVLLLSLAVLDRLARLERRLGEGDARQREILAALRGAEGAPAGEEARTAAGGPRFSWLERGTEALEWEHHSHVFVPVLMATGAALSGLAWLVERAAGATARPAAGRRLARRFAVLAAPPGGYLAGARDLPPRPALAGPGSTRGGLRGLAWLTAALLCALLVAGLAELTETAPPEHGEATATSLLFTVEGHGVTAERSALAARQLWERCRDATSVPLGQAGMTRLDEGLYAATVHPSLSAHDEHRLEGCLEDATLDRIRLHVLGTGSVE
ncbi:hypothetical protein [Streptomyces hoynatensis]|uniref:Uncharacterized protein n=1 Tax=Streptomyces hoynatensis TaxID=1141874 RepID=A0A3A9ZGI3_9ACTN|nr:hypothetical protein [Streptomyces hoynatensis]RKN47175.1 hypothetical protein D7294_03120 [Streptomyces hoynatensis]